MPLLALLPLIRAALGGLWAAATSPLGRLVVVAAVAWLWSGHRERVACDARAEAFRAELQRATDAEHARRLSAIAEANAVAEVEARALAAKNQDFETRLKEIEHASRAADAHPCLDGAASLRLDRLSR